LNVFLVRVRNDVREDGGFESINPIPIDVARVPMCTRNTKGAPQKGSKEIGNDLSMGAYVRDARARLTYNHARRELW